MIDIHHQELESFSTNMLRESFNFRRGSNASRR
jgi:hypothetical protein